jgi:hypothetical protein
MLPPGFGLHGCKLLGEPESLSIEECAPLQFTAVLVQVAAKAVELEPLHPLDERPQRARMERDSTAHFIGHALVVVATFVQEQQPAHLAS